MRLNNGALVQCQDLFVLGNGGIIILYQDVFRCIMNIILRCFEIESPPSPMHVNKNPRV